jgi:hypothetical protein
MLANERDLKPCSERATRAIQRSSASEISQNVQNPSRPDWRESRQGLTAAAANVKTLYKAEGGAQRSLSG